MRNCFVYYSRRGIRRGLLGFLKYGELVGFFFVLRVIEKNVKIRSIKIVKFYLLGMCYVVY